MDGEQDRFQRATVGSNRIGGKRQSRGGGGAKHHGIHFTLRIRKRPEHNEISCGGLAQRHSRALSGKRKQGSIYDVSYFTNVASYAGGGGKGKHARWTSQEWERETKGKRGVSQGRVYDYLIWGSSGKLEQRGGPGNGMKRSKAQ